MSAAADARMGVVNAPPVSPAERCHRARRRRNDRRRRRRNDRACERAIPCFAGFPTLPLRLNSASGRDALIRCPRHALLNSTMRTRVSTALAQTQWEMHHTETESRDSRRTGLRISIPRHRTGGVGVSPIDTGCVMSHRRLNHRRRSPAVGRSRPADSRGVLPRLCVFASAIASEAGTATLRPHASSAAASMIDAQTHYAESPFFSVFDGPCDARRRGTLTNATCATL